MCPYTGKRIKAGHYTVYSVNEFSLKISYVSELFYSTNKNNITFYLQSLFVYIN